MAERERRVDPSTMKTEAGREMAERANRRREVSRTRLHRSVQVLNEFILFADDVQLDLAEEALVWTFASLTLHDRREVCEASFYALIDEMYAGTEEAENTLSVAERHHLCLAARGAQEQLFPLINEILRDAGNTLAAIEKRATADSRSTAAMLAKGVASVADQLHQLRATHLEHAPPYLLPDLIGHCVLLCQAIDAQQLGLDNGSEFVAALKHVSVSAGRIFDAVSDAVDKGQLAIRDGKIVVAPADSPAE